MDLNPPAGSKISIVSEGTDPTIVVPGANSSMRYFFGLLLLFWLGGWALGFTSAGSQILSGNANAFIIFWLGGWTLGGICGAYTLYRAFRPPVPETLELKRNSLTYDFGIPPVQFGWSDMISRSAWSSVAFPKRVRVDLDRRQLQSLRLIETEFGNSLTVDVDAVRIDVAPTANEVEREWLAHLLAQRYSLPLVLGNAAASDGNV
jgi:hypothetical protein